MQGVIDQKAHVGLLREARGGHIPPHPIIVGGIDQLVVVVMGVHDPSQGDLPGIAHTPRAHCLNLRPAQRRQKEAGQNGDDGNNDQQLDQREAPDW